MVQAHAELIAGELHVALHQVVATAKLLAEDCTIPFIARYRKESTGGLDEVQIISIRDRLEQLEALDKRREAISKSLAERNLLSKELDARINEARSLSELEDLYLPYRPKRKTRASAARDKGLEPLAQEVFGYRSLTPEKTAARFIAPASGLSSAEEALSGARDIIAEWISEDTLCRQRMRNLWQSRCCIESKVIKGKETEGNKFKDYFNWSEPVKSIPSHRLLAILRGEREEVLRLAMSYSQKLWTD